VTTVYYFSGTGNSLAVAKNIASVLRPCDLVPVPLVLKNPSLFENDDERIGIVTPLYFFGLPNIVTRFLKKAAFTKAKYIFLIVTSGFPFGVAAADANALLKAKGQELSYARHLSMPDNYLPIYNLPPERVERVLKRARPHLAAVVSDLVMRRKHDLNRPAARLQEALFAPPARWWHRTNFASLPADDRNFTVGNSCSSCGICQKVCPADNISFDGKRPAWQHHCEQCLACLHFCPKEAIEFGRRTWGKHRYHHPSVTWQEIAAQK